MLILEWVTFHNCACQELRTPTSWSPSYYHMVHVHCGVLWIMLKLTQNHVSPCFLSLEFGHSSWSPSSKHMVHLVGNLQGDNWSKSMRAGARECTVLYCELCCYLWAGASSRLSLYSPTTLRKYAWSYSYCCLRHHWQTFGWSHHKAEKKWKTQQGFTNFWLYQKSVKVHGVAGESGRFQIARVVEPCDIGIGHAPPMWKSTGS